MNELNKKLGELLIFISDVAVSVRMNTAYNGSSIDNKDTPRAAMWLVDMLHNFKGIGFALSESKPDKAIQELNILKSIWTTDKLNIEQSLNVNEHGHNWSVEDGINLLTNIEIVIKNGNWK